MTNLSNSSPVPIATKTILEFIREYRRVQQMKYKDSFVVLEHLDPEKRIFWHILDLWKTNKKDFGPFYLNLDTLSQIRLQEYFGIADADNAKYIIESALSSDLIIDGPIPQTSQQLRNLLVFFTTHSLEAGEEFGLTSHRLPAGRKREGNAKNWGDYVLAHPNPDLFLQRVVIQNW